jgi:RNA polymerase sigma-70 factor, ECF subfamily
MAQGAGPHKQPLFAADSAQPGVSGRPEYRRGQSVCPGDMVLVQGATSRVATQVGLPARESALSGFRQGIEAAVPALRRYARALTRNAELADDLVQDTLVRALRSEHLFHGGELRSWLYTILTNLNRNRLRSLARRPAVQSIEDNDAPDMAGPEAGARDIERALASLVEDQRTALLLVVLEGLSYREVAEVQGVPIGTVMSRLACARVQIKAYLDGERPALRRIK